MAEHLEFLCAREELAVDRPSRWTVDQIDEHVAVARSAWSSRTKKSTSLSDLGPPRAQAASPPPSMNGMSASRSAAAARFMLETRSSRSLRSDDIPACVPGRGDRATSAMGLPSRLEPPRVARDQPARSAQRRRRSRGDASLLEDVMRELEVFEQVRPPCLAIVACAENGGGMNGNEGRKPVSDLQRSAT